MPSVAKIATTIGLSSLFHTLTVSANTCQVGGLSVTTNVRYITGSHGIEGSIYASCIDSTPTCYIDNRVRDAVTAEQVPCDDETIHASRRRLGVYLSGNGNNYWPQGVVCWTFGATYSSTQQQVFLNAIEEYHKYTAVKFVRFEDCAGTFPDADTPVCGGCTQKMQIVNNDGDSDCYATLGYAPNQRMDLNFGMGCFAGSDGGLSVAVHELGHVVGLIHEHTHPQREVVVLRNSLTLSADNYVKEDGALTTAYDSGSIMHYARSTGLCIPLDRSLTYCDIDQTAGEDGCVEPTEDMCDTSLDDSFGHASTLMESDIATIAKIYGSGGGGDVSTPTTAPSTETPTTAPTATPIPTPPDNNNNTTDAPEVVTTPAPETPVTPEPTSVDTNQQDQSVTTTITTTPEPVVTDGSAATTVSTTTNSTTITTNSTSTSGSTSTTTTSTTITSTNSGDGSTAPLTTPAPASLTSTPVTNTPTTPNFSQRVETEEKPAISADDTSVSSNNDKDDDVATSNSSSKEEEQRVAGEADVTTKPFKRLVASDLEEGPSADIDQETPSFLSASSTTVDTPTIANDSPDIAPSPSRKSTICPF